jgi:thioredoxin reductase
MSANPNGFDVAVVGGGPAGLSAGIISSFRGLKTAVFEGGTWGGLLSTIYPYKLVFNYPGIPKILASHLVSEWVGPIPISQYERSYFPPGLVMHS